MRCEPCGTPGLALHPAIRGNETTTLYRCPSCGCCRVDPPFPEGMLQDLYREGYFSDAPWEIQKAQILAEDYLDKLTAFLQEGDARGKTALEVGAGYGFLANSLSRRLGIAVDVIEPNRHGREYMARHFPAVNVIGTDIDQIPSDRLYDDILSLHVVEHLQRLGPFLERLSRHLRPGGRMHVLTPSADSSAYRRWGSQWGWACPNQHYQFLSPRMPETFFEDHGFRVASCRALTPAAVHFPSVWRTRLVHWADTINRRVAAMPRRRTPHWRLTRRLMEGLARRLDQNRAPGLALRLERWLHMRRHGPGRDELHLVLERMARSTIRDGAPAASTPQLEGRTTGRTCSSAAPDDSAAIPSLRGGPRHAGGRAPGAVSGNPAARDMAPAQGVRGRSVARRAE